MKLITDDGREFRIETVKSAELGPGDFLIVSAPNVISQYVRDGIRKGMRQVFPDNECIIISEGLDLSILRKKINEEKNDGDD